MRIDWIELQNFKKYKKQEFKFPAQFTLLVGDNGSGKTTVLDALAVAASVWLVESPDSILNNSRRNIGSAEMRLEPVLRGDRIQFDPQSPVVVSARGKIGGQEDVIWSRQIRPGGSRTTNADARKAIDLIEGLYAQDRDGAHMPFPVLAYYGAGRGWIASNERKKEEKAKGPARRWAAFYDCFSERIRFSDLQEWFKSETIERGNRGGRWRPGFGVVRRALLQCIPNADDIWFDGDCKQIVFSIKNNAQPFDNLSAGQRMMLALVADLAIKAVTQNAYLLPSNELGPEDEPLPRVLAQTPGVVLIDELDVHLHPTWQRRVAKDLKKTFPCIQFICTSHSPQVVGELQPEEIILLKDDEYSNPVQSFGMDSNWVVEQLMGGDKCDPVIKADTDKMLKLIDERKLAEAENEIVRLRGLSGNKDDLQRAMSMIERIRLVGK